MAKSRIVMALLAMLLLVVGMGFYETSTVYGAEPGVYTTTVVTHYRHPQTGIIEDSGGESKYEIGQGMTEGATSKKGLIEVDESGQMYGTIRLILMDAMSNVSFEVDGSPVNDQITKENGKEVDFRIPINSENSVVRCAAHVDPMGRDVIYYITFSGLTAGSDDFNPQIDLSAANTNTQKANISQEATTTNEPKDSKVTKEETKHEKKDKAKDEKNQKSSKDKKLTKSKDKGLSFVTICIIVAVVAILAYLGMYFWKKKAKR